MVTVAQFIPQDPEQKESVLAVLREHPELREFIQHASEKADEVFPNVRISLDTVQYDEWDPPVTMTINVIQSWSAFHQSYNEYVNWLISNPDFPRELILVMPVWHGPLETYS